MIIENKDFRTWDLEFIKKIKVLRLNIDMIVGFLENGNLAAPTMLRIVDRQIELYDEALESDDMIAVMGNDWHDEDSAELDFYGVHAVKNSKEAEVIKPLRKYEEKGIVFHKNSTNLIQVDDFREFLLMLVNLERVEITGVLSDKCVDNAAVGIKTFFDEHNRRVEVCVHQDAIDTFDAPGHNAEEETELALRHMKSNGVKVLGKKIEYKRVI